MGRSRWADSMKENLLGATVRITAAKASTRGQQGYVAATEQRDGQTVYDICIGHRLLPFLRSEFEPVARMPRNRAQGR